MFVLSARQQGRGHHLDRKGEVWQQIQSGYVTKMEYENDIGYSFILKFEPVSVTDTSVSTKNRMVSIDVNKASGKITQSYQREADKRISDTIMRSESAHRAFDWNGNPWMEVVNVQNQKKIVDFSPRFNRNTQEFVAYLRSHGLEELIPD
jgi:hypothetical protein